MIDIAKELRLHNMKDLASDVERGVEKDLVLYRLQYVICHITVYEKFKKMIEENYP